MLLRFKLLTQQTWRAACRVVLEDSLLPLVSFPVLEIRLSKRAEGYLKNCQGESYYAHTNLVVVSEQLAKEEGILKILDGIERILNSAQTPPLLLLVDRKHPISFNSCPLLKKFRLMQSLNS